MASSRSTSGRAPSAAASRASASRRSAAQRAEHSSEVVRVGEAGALDVVVVADTHGQAHPNARPLIERIAPALIVHAGDIGDVAVLEPLRQVAPLLAVRGNIDARMPGFVDSMDIEFVSDQRSLLKVLLTHIAVYGPKLRGEVAKLAGACSARLVLCGHSHVPFLGRDKGLVMFNPGSIGPRRFQLPITFGVLSIRPDGVSLRHISCETGETWLP